MLRFYSYLLEARSSRIEEFLDTMRQIETYLDTENIGPDPNWGENGAMGEVPAGSYYLIATINGESVRAEFMVNAGETTFVEIRTEQ